MNWTWWHSFAAIGLLLSLMPVLGWIEVRETEPTRISLEEFVSKRPLRIWLQLEDCVPDASSARLGTWHRRPYVFVPLRSAGTPQDQAVSVVAVYPEGVDPAGLPPGPMTGRRAYWDRPSLRDLELPVMLDQGVVLLEVGAQPRSTLAYASFFLCGALWLVFLPLALIRRLGRRECPECGELIPADARRCSACGIDQELPDPDPA